MITPTFILGAGFNADAAGEAGRQQHDSGYPLVGDMLGLCFNLPAVPDGKSIEDLFSDALERDPGPIRKLADRLRQADHDLAYNLAQTGGLNSRSTTIPYPKRYCSILDAGSHAMGMG